jgi:GNAT superfamily N-acetyltransferase
VSDLPRLRTLHGRSTAAWVGDGLREIGAHHWLALSGAPHADYNLALCHGPHAPVDEVRDALVEHRTPAILALADADSGPLVDAGWRPVGDAPLMVCSTGGHSADPDVRPLTDLGETQRLVADVYGLDGQLAEVAVRPGSIPGRTVWGLFDDGRLAACLLAVRVEDAVVIWSMATDPGSRRRGFGRRLLDAALHGAAADGATDCLLHASAMGEPFYVAAGFETVERWEFWSRPRWVLAS